MIGLNGEIALHNLWARESVDSGIIEAFADANADLNHISNGQ